MEDLGLDSLDEESKAIEVSNIMKNQVLTSEENLGLFTTSLSDRLGDFPFKFWGSVEVGYYAKLLAFVHYLNKGIPYYYNECISKDSRSLYHRDMMTVTNSLGLKTVDSLLTNIPPDEKSIDIYISLSFRIVLMYKEGSETETYYNVLLRDDT